MATMVSPDFKSARLTLDRVEVRADDRVGRLHGYVLRVVLETKVRAWIRPAHYRRD